jgi:flagellar protein FlgJ
MNTSALSPAQAVRASDIPLERLAENKQLNQNDKIKEAARQFEAVLVRQILSAARKSIIPSTVNPQSCVSGIYDDMINVQLAESISRSGSLGLAATLDRQLSRQQTSGAQEVSQASTVPSAESPLAPREAIHDARACHPNRYPSP